MWYSERLALRHYPGLMIKVRSIKVPNARCGEGIQLASRVGYSHVRAFLGVDLEV